MDCQYVVTIGKAICKVSRGRNRWTIVPPRGQGLPHLPRYADRDISNSPVVSLPGVISHITDANSEVAEFPPGEPNYRKKLLVLHRLLVDDLYHHPVGKTLTLYLTAPFRWARRIHTERNMTYKIVDGDWISFWRRRLWCVLIVLVPGISPQILD